MADKIKKLPISALRGILKDAKANGVDLKHKAVDLFTSSTAGLWPDLKETGLEYERRLRKGWKKRRSA